MNLALALEMNPENTLKKYNEISGIKVIKLPGSVRPDTKVDTYEKLQKYYVDQIIEGLK